MGPDDVVLEVGAAGGQLTRPLLERARLVHAFEIDRRWLPRLEELAAADPRLVLHAGDALKADLGALDPPPTALVANLAYNIAIPLIMTTIAELPSVRRWAVMVQRELGERLFAVPSTKAYAAVSVLTQLACRLEKVRAGAGLGLPPAAARGVELRHASCAPATRRRRARRPAGVRGRRRTSCGSRSGSAARCSSTRSAARPTPAPRSAATTCARRSLALGAERGGAAGGALAAAVADVRRRARPPGGRGAGGVRRTA